MGNFIVYKHTSPSGKCYVGITSQAPKYRCDLEGNLIATYFGVRGATRCTGINSSHIGDCCNHKPNRKTAGGFKWEWQ